jgi:hypothetical protein
MRIFLLGFLVFINVSAERVLIPQIVESNPESNTVGTLTHESPWLRSKSLDVRRAGFDTPIRIRSLIYKNIIYFQLKWKDEVGNRQHKPWRWDGRKEAYIVGEEREDALIMRWEINTVNDDSSGAKSKGAKLEDENSKMDLWYWGSVRTKDFADDMSEIISAVELARGVKREEFQLMRNYSVLAKGDSGARGYKSEFRATGFMTKPRYSSVIPPPTGGRVDISLKALHYNKEWTLEFKRNLTTGHSDDVNFKWEEEYFFDIYALTENRAKPVRYPLKPHEYEEIIDWYEYSESIVEYFKYKSRFFKKLNIFNLIMNFEKRDPLKLRIEDFHKRILEETDGKNEKN